MDSAFSVLTLNTAIFSLAILRVERSTFNVPPSRFCSPSSPPSERAEKWANGFFCSGTKVGKKQPVTRPVNTPPRGKKKRPKSLAISPLEANLAPIFKDAAGAFYHPCVF